MKVKITKVSVLKQITGALRGREKYGQVTYDFRFNGLVIMVSNVFIDTRDGALYRRLRPFETKVKVDSDSRKDLISITDEYRIAIL